MRRRQYDAAAIRRVSVQEIATELGIDEPRVRRLLSKHGWWIGDGMEITLGRRPKTYDARVIDTLRGLLGQPHRQLEPPESDWLSRYLGGT